MRHLDRAPLRVGLALAALAACRAPAASTADPATPGEHGPTETGAVATAPRMVDLPTDWHTRGRHAFERWLADAFAPAGPATVGDAEVALLAGALAGFDERAVRAALILAHADGSLPARDALVRRLAERAVAPDRPSDAADVVAAAGLATRADGRAVAPALVELAVGAEPHPDLEVRVECAATALAFGHAEVVPFLLRVLRELTPAMRDDPPDWEPKTTMAWSKSRAAHALSLAAGLPLAFRPDAPVAVQMREADRLEAALLGSP